MPTIKKVPKPKTPPIKVLKAQGRVHRANLKAEAKAKAKQAKWEYKMKRGIEAYKTQRTNARAAAAASAVTSAEESRQKTKRIEAEERTKQITAQAQYAKLINGNIGEENPINPTEDGASGTSAWTAKDLIG